MKRNNDPNRRLLNGVAICLAACVFGYLIRGMEDQWILENPDSRTAGITHGPIGIASVFRQFAPWAVWLVGIILITRATLHCFRHGGGSPLIARWSWTAVIVTAAIIRMIE